jgi:dipeptidase E
MRRLLLVSSSTVHGGGYLDHCEDEVRKLFDGVARVLFVPFALHDRDGYAGTARARFEAMDLDMDSVHEASDPVAAVESAEGVFVGGGNTFRLLKTIHELRLIEPLRRRAHGGMPYMGTSAGSNLACPTIRTTNDMPIVFPATFEALDLVPFQINPHYIDADPDSKHMGETRETRLAEYLEENDLPVLGIREGAMVAVSGDRGRLAGTAGARLFRRGETPRELTAGADLSFLLR